RHWPRYETVRGELLVSPAPLPWHQEIVGRLFVALHLYLEREPAGHVWSAPADISWGLPDNLVQPDVFATRIDEARAMEWSRIRHLLLAAEVLSPSSARADRFAKRRLYQEQDTPLYWVVDSEAHTAEVWTPEERLPRPEREILTWHPSSASAPFHLKLDELFRPL
ncbi:MAG TPA: Uma2 family endonuclease, partial [Gemmatimonadaceae bacterium]